MDELDKELAKARQTVAEINHLIDRYRFKLKEEREALERYPLYQAETDYLTRRTNAK